MENDTVLLAFIVFFLLFIALNGIVQYFIARDVFDRLKDQLTSTEKNFGSKLNTFRGTLKREVMSGAKEILPDTQDWIPNAIKGVADYFKEQRNTTAAVAQDTVAFSEEQLKVLSEEIREDERKKIAAKDI